MQLRKPIQHVLAHLCKDRSPRRFTANLQLFTNFAAEPVSLYPVAIVGFNAPFIVLFIK